MTTAAAANSRRPGLKLGDGWLLGAAFAALALPTMLRLANQEWSKETGAQGPIVLATGAWLLWRQIPELRRLGSPGQARLTALVLVAALAAYVFGRAYDFITLEAGGVYGAGVAILHTRYGVRALARIWFPLLYLAFAVPPPAWILDAVTAPLKRFVSTAAVHLLGALGLPVARDGVTIIVAQYQLLVEDACSGLNSIIGLTAVGLLYIYLTRGSLIVYSIALTALVIPIAIVANIIRVSIIVVVTYIWGDQVGQSFIHFAAGLVLFATALLLVFAIDRLIFFVIGTLRRPA